SDVRLTVVGGAVAAVTDDGIAAFEHDRVTVLARVAVDDRGRHAGGILGVADDRVARFVDPSTVAVTGLRAGDPTVVRVTGAAEPGRIAVTPVAGGFDPTCGLTGAARSASLPTLGPFASAPDGGVWLAAGGRLLRAGPDGVLRAVRGALPGEVTAMVTTADGS